MTARDGQSKLWVVPLTVLKANEFVAVHHRHHAPVPLGLPWFAIGAVAAKTVRGVAIGGRPSNRNNDDGQTVEVLRIASDGTPNVCSLLVAACGRVARELGAARCITYTLEKESGSSLRAAGWVREKDGIQSAWMYASTRTAAVDRDHMSEPKVRWALHIRAPLEYDVPVTEIPEQQPTLFVS